MPVQAQLKAAIGHHQAGRYAEAEAGYRQVLAASPRNPDALHMLGLLAHHVGQHQAAVELISQAVDLVPRHAPALTNLASVLGALGRWEAALDSCNRALAVDPTLVAAHLNRGNALRAQGLLEPAAESYRQALLLRRDYPEAFYNLGLVLEAQGKRDEAARSLRRALEVRPTYAEAHNLLGNLHQAQGRIDEAVTCYGRAIALQPGFAEAHNNLGLALAARGDSGEAIRSLERALTVRPDYAEAHNNLGAQLEAAGRHEDALASYRRALELRPEFPEAWNNVGNAQQAAGKLDEALASYRRALALRPDYADAWNNLGNALQAAGRPDEAIRSHDQALALKPDDPDAQWNKAFALLLMGDFPRGWAQFEWRWAAQERHGFVRRFTAPPWLGEQPVAGKRLLLHHEQGFGDMLQMLRYVPSLAGQGATVIVEVPAALATLAMSADGVAEVVVAGDTLPDHDLHCPFMSVPLACRTTLETVPAAVPYLRAPEGEVARWGRKLGPRTRLRVGLVWSGSTGHRNDRQRSVALAQLLPLLEADAEFISLQREYRPADRALLDAEGRIRDFADGLTDFAATAALMSHLDLVITVDTAAAHLAGALGIPVWLMLPYAPDYRWMLGRTDSPWYPTMRLFRQPSPGDWESVLASILDECQESGP